ncbi:translation initiation factor IF-3 [Patescibacteria group bacterium]|nr:translation initiation factor IF-3 [Patescibacteria group bacterium]MBU1885872.1 translation initiation factor IF-3 [Patescibacteria group bacterium]
MGRRHYSKHKKRDRIIANLAIRVPQVRVIDSQGGQVGIMSTDEALDQAKQQNKDLVLITEKAKPPVAKIIELSKHKYWLQQKKAEQRKSARQQEIKGVRLTPFIDEGDFQTRLKRIKKFLEDGDKVRVEADFRRGRQRTKKEFGFKNFERIIEEIQELADVEIKPKSVGTKVMMQLTPTKK